MKKIIYFLFVYINFILSVSLILINSESCARRRHNPYIWYADPTLSKDNRTVTSNSVVFLGDSLTHYAVWMDYFPNIKTANQGIGGNRTSDVLARLDEVLMQKPKKIFLLIGVNDIFTNVPTSVTIENFGTIITKILTESPKTTLYVQSVFPLGHHISKDSKSFVSAIITLNQALMNFCTMYNIPYIDVYNALADNQGYLKDPYTTDQIHLSPQGYQIWVSMIQRFVLE